jgi:hypothetical protein
LILLGFFISYVFLVERRARPPAMREQTSEI